MTPQWRVVVWPRVWIFETAPVPVTPVTIILRCDPYPCHTLLADLIFLCPLALFFSPGMVICLHLCCPLPIPPSPFRGLKQHSPWFLVIATLSSLCSAPPCSLPFANHSQQVTFDVSWHAVPLHYQPMTLHEMLATANMIPASDLPTIPDTTDVIVDISCQLLWVVSHSWIYEIVPARWFTPLTH